MQSQTCPSKPHLPPSCCPSLKFQLKPPSLPRLLPLIGTCYIMTGHMGLVLICYVVMVTHHGDKEHVGRGHVFYVGFVGCLHTSSVNHRQEKGARSSAAPPVRDTRKGF